jgi:serine/threonine protein kinase
MLAPRSLVGRYTIRQHLGAGGMGDVYIAHDPTLDRLVAVKVLAEELASDADRLARFVREARAASALNHPSILTVFDFGQHEGMHYLVTELVDGRTLRKWSSEERPPLGAVLEVIAQVATALWAAHAAGIVHRDVKPENLMLRRDGLVKVLDFGIAKLLVEPASKSDAAGHTGPNRQTMPGTILGTMRYMSPEQAMGVAVDARSDIWSLGVVLYELVAGRPPFAGPTPMSTLAMIMGLEPEPLDAIAPGTTEAVSRILASTPRKRDVNRFAPSGELAAALRQVQRELVHDTSVGRGSDTQRVSATSVAGAPPPTNLPASA